MAKNNKNSKGKPAAKPDTPAAKPNANANEASQTTEQSSQEREYTTYVTPEERDAIAKIEDGHERMAKLNELLTTKLEHANAALETAQERLENYSAELGDHIDRDGESEFDPQAVDHLYDEDSRDEAEAYCDGYPSLQEITNAALIIRDRLNNYPLDSDDEFNQIAPKVAQQAVRLAVEVRKARQEYIDSDQARIDFELNQAEAEVRREQSPTLA